MIAVLLVIQAVSSAGGFAMKTETATMSSTTSLTTTTSGGGNAPASGGLHYVTFYDSGPCGANSTWGAHFTQWGVQLGNRTRTEPSNMTLSEIPENGYSADSSFNLTRIAFLVPNGEYNFTLYPTTMRVGSSNGTELGGSTGTVTVTNSDVNVFTVSVAFSAECQQ